MTGAVTLIGLLAVVLAASAAPEPGDVGRRVADAMSAEQNLQGPLDGSWLLRDTAGRLLYRLEIVDPADGRGPLTGAWRDAGGARGGEVGFIAAVRRAGQNLQLEFSTGGGRASLRLTRQSSGIWIGRLIEGGERRAVVLRRN